MTYAIFDIDGTLSDPSRRLHYLDEGDWDSFYAHCGEDAPIAPVVQFCRSMALWHKILIFTGRPSAVAEHTIKWLHEHGIEFSAIHFRKPNNGLPAAVIKAQWLKQYNLDEIVFAVEDSPAIIEMYRRRGIVCITTNGFINFT